jgi:hypothetical protein
MVWDHISARMNWDNMGARIMQDTTIISLYNDNCCDEVGGAA